MTVNRNREDVIGYRVLLGGGRFAESVIGRLIYGHRPKWLTAQGGFTSSNIHGAAATVSLFGLGASTVVRDEYNNVLVYPEGEGSLVVANGLAGKVGKVTPYTHGDWCDDYAKDQQKLEGD